MICEGCIKEDVCKYWEKVKKWERRKATVEGLKMPEGLSYSVECKYKVIDPR